jgi:hypothetical protein
MPGRLCGRNADGGDSEPHCNPVGDVAERNASLVDTVVLGPCFSLFEGKPKKLGGVEPVDRGPSVGAVAYVGETPFLRAASMICGMKP